MSDALLKLTKKAAGGHIGDFFKGGYVMVVEDVPNMCKTLRNMLRGSGVENIADADDGDTALDILRNVKHRKLEQIKEEARNNCLFILLDWHMPRMSGLEVAQEIRADKALENIPILMVTAEGGRDLIVQASAEVGVNGFILKPFSATDLEVKIMGIMKQRLNPPEHVKLIKASEQLMAQGRFDDGLGLLNRALAVSGQHTARIHVLRGDLLKEKGDFEEARKALNEAEAANPHYLKAFVASADLFMRQGNKEEALVHLNKAASISPHNAKRHASIGKILLEKGDEKAAQEAFNQAIGLEPKQAMEVAEAFLEAGNAQQAEEYFRRSLPKEGKTLSAEERKDYVHTANRLGIALRRQGKLKEAIEEYQKARKQEPEDEAIYFNMGKAYIELIKKEGSAAFAEKALKCFKKAVELDPDFEEAKIEIEKLKEL